jgi:hypothetical protein
MFAPQVPSCQYFPSHVVVSPWSFIGCGSRQAGGGQGSSVQVEHSTPQKNELVTGWPAPVVIVTHVSLQFTPTHQSELLPFAAVSWKITVPGHVSGASGRDASSGWPPLPPEPDVVPPEPDVPPPAPVVSPPLPVVVVLPVSPPAPPAPVAVDPVDALDPALPVSVPASGCGATSFPPHASHAIPTITVKHRTLPRIMSTSQASDSRS